MFTETYSDTFEFAGHVVEVECETLPGESASFLRDLIHKDEHGRAEIVLLGAAIKHLTVGGETIIKSANRQARRAGAAATTTENLPSLYDHETWESLPDKLLSLVIAHEFWLAMKSPFAEVFAKYAPDELFEEKDPTKPPREPSTVY